MELSHIYNENCLNTMARMPDKFVDLIVTDPPYNAINRATNGLRSFDKGTADSAPIDIQALAKEFYRVCKGSMYIFCGDEQYTEWITTLKGLGLATRICAWQKTNPSPMNGQYTWLSAIELCVFAKHKGATFNRHCASPVWKYPVVANQSHPTQKPVLLFSELIQASSNEGDVVYDPFLGSGTCAISALMHQRQWFGSEISEEYTNIANKRINSLVVNHSLF